MADIHATLMYQWFDEIAAGRKTAEYRRITPYWEKKLTNIKPGDCIVFHRGYSDKTIKCRIRHIGIVSGWDMPHREYKYFGCPNESQFFEIEFEKCLTF